MIEKNEKLTIRISDDELQEIDSFLSTNNSFTNRSEFIRMAVLEYISFKRVGIINKNGMKMEPAIEKAVSKIVAAGYFKSVESAYTEIIREAWKQNIVSGLLEKSVGEGTRIDNLLKGEMEYDKL
ncbi:MAG: ribbon-helix-helix domain-containing protein [Ferroplasma sp.]